MKRLRKMAVGSVGSLLAPALLAALAAGCRSPEHSPTRAELQVPPPRVTLAKLAPVRAVVEDNAPPARRGPPEGARAFFQVARAGRRLVGPVEVAGKVAALAPDGVSIVPAQGAPLDLMFKLPPEMPVRFAVGDPVDVAYNLDRSRGDHQEQLTVRKGGKVALATATLHGSRPIEHLLLGGALRVRQTVRAEPAEPLPRGQGTRHPMTVEATWGNQTRSLQPDTRLDVTTPAGTHRLWVLGSTFVEPAPAARGAAEGRPYHLALILTER